MALQSSPYGGTTSLPQYLQKRQPQPQKPQPQTQPAGPTPPPATMRPVSAQANVKPAGGANLQNPGATNGMIGGMTQPAGSPGMVGSQPIPPAPPPPAAPAVGMQPGGQQVARTDAPPQAPAPQPDSFGLPDIIKRMLGQPGRYDDQTIQDMRTASQQRLEDERRMSEDRLTANAASRGLLRSSGLSTSLGDTEERYLRAMMQSEADINRQVADARQQDLLAAIQAAFGFGQGELQQQGQEQNYMLALAQLGLLGGPTVPGAAAGFDALPQPGVPGDSSGWYEWLMQNMGKGATA